MSLQSYDDVINYLEKKRRPKHLLLGNGFSMAYDPNIFSYNALNKIIDELEDELLRKLFEIINTKIVTDKNFKVVVEPNLTTIKLMPYVKWAKEVYKKKVANYNAINHWRNSS